MQFYSNPERESDPHSLPDAEVFYRAESECNINLGWYYHFVNTATSQYFGPFDTQDLAIADARESI